MTCQACHTVFPELTPFGRRFKLTGYQIDNLPQVQGITPSKEVTLLLNQIPPLSLMFQGSLTRTGKPLPDSGVPGVPAQNDQVLSPTSESLLRGSYRPQLWRFHPDHVQRDSGTIGWDNTDIRYAKQVHGVTGLTYGATVNNNPTVQDVWNKHPRLANAFRSEDQRGAQPRSLGAN